MNIYRSKTKALVDTLLSLRLEYIKAASHGYYCNNIILLSRRNNIALYDAFADVGADYIAITNGTVPLYAMLGDPTNEYASHLRVQKASVIKAILTQAPPTPALQVFITKEI